jgi:hypothetical protein
MDAAAVHIGVHGFTATEARTAITSGLAKGATSPAGPPGRPHDQPATRPRRHPHRTAHHDRRPLRDHPRTHDPAVDHQLKLAALVVNAAGFIYIFLALHQPGGLRTVVVRTRCRRLYRRMEGAWLWDDRRAARDAARQVLDLSREVWACYGSAEARFLSGLSLYVLTPTPGSGPVSVDV